MSPAGPNPRYSILGGVGLLLVGLVALQFGFAESSLLYLAPALMILLPLAFDRYPGQRLLQAAIGQSWEGYRPTQLSRRRLHLPPLLPRGGALLALALAGRGPPRQPAALPARPYPLPRTEKGKLRCDDSHSQLRCCSR